MPRKLIVLLLAVFLVPSILFAGVTGKIAGTVVDVETGAPLIGANVIIEGTNMGTATNLDGYYFIINVPPGTYRVKAMMMGYQSVVKTNVKVIVDLTSKVNFKLSSTVISGEAVEIVAKRPLLEKDVTASQTVTSTEQIEQMPVTSYNEVLVTTPGFVESGTGLNRGYNVRGGRGGEMAYMVDGFYIEDPLMGGMGSDVANVGIAELAVMTGTFNAEYGEAMSGVLNIVTKEGGNNYEGRIRFFTDKYVNPHTINEIYKHLRDGKEWVKIVDGDTIGPVSDTDVGTQPVIPGQNKQSEEYWGTREIKVDDYNSYRPDFYLGGPLPFLPRGNSFFVSGDLNNTDTYLGYTGQPYRKRRRVNGKIAIKPLDNLKIIFGGLYSWYQGRSYSHSYKYTPEMVPTSYDESYMINATITHTISPSTFYTVRASQFTKSHDYYRYKAEEFFSAQDESGEWLINDPATGLYTGAVNDPISDAEYEFNTGWWVYEKDEEGNKIDSTWTVGGGTAWNSRKNIITTVKIDMTSQVSRVHQFKLGAEYKHMDIETYYVSAPYSAKAYVERYHHKPVEGSAYIQDKMEFEDWGMVINAGLRIDYMDTKAVYFVDPTKPTESGLKEAEKKFSISPRIGFAHPITDKAVLHFAYGHFYQVPEYQYIYYFENSDYVNYPYPDLSINSIYSWIGNSNLRPQKTIAYEVGIKTKINEVTSIDFTLYYKDIFDYTALRRVLATPTSYFRYDNYDYANSKGLEITLEKRFSNHFGGRVNYTFSRAEGNASGVTSHYNDWYSFSVYKTYPPKKTVTMDWDQTHTVNFVLNFADPGKWGINLTGNHGSGLPYTPLNSRGIRLDEPNSARMPWTMTVDLRATKYFKFVGLDMALYADVRNIFNKRNVLAVWGQTGEPDATNDWDDTKDWLSRPHYFSAPRTLELGMSIGFK